MQLCVSGPYMFGSRGLPVRKYDANMSGRGQWDSLRRLCLIDRFGSFDYQPTPPPNSLAAGPFLLTSLIKPWVPTCGPLEEGRVPAPRNG